ncbi:MAG TPA: HDIG domain-containing protein, partial [Thermoleophilaceae bacterium]|nr:HDIG domain-containing protein [Thermoleophilaceae bacterium]
DLAVAGDPEGAARAVARGLGGPVFPLSEAFGTWRAIDGRRRFVCDVSALQGEDVAGDLARRDFTVNAMAVPLTGGALLDPHGGRGDAAAGLLRVMGEAAYRADPLRPLRLVRLAAELPLAPDQETERLTRAAAGSVTRASPERVFAELRRLIVSDRLLDGLALSDRLGLTAAVLPEVEALRGVEQSRYHHLDVHGHTMEVVARQLELERRGLEELFAPDASALAAVLDEPLSEELTRGQALRLGALLHDVGKPPTHGVRDDGRITFIGHDALGERMVRAICRRLRTSERLASFLGALTRHHLSLGFLVHRRPLDRRTIYRYLASSHPVEVEVTLLSCADRLATRGRGAEEAIAAHLDLARELMREALAWRADGPPRPPLRGDELADELGLEPGPELGRLLAELEEARFAGEVRTRAQAVEHARRSLAASRAAAADR